LCDFVAPSFTMSLEKIHFVLTSYFVLAAVRVALCVKSYYIRKLCCYQISCKKKLCRL